MQLSLSDGISLAFGWMVVAAAETSVPSRAPYGGATFPIGAVSAGVTTRGSLAAPTGQQALFPGTAHMRLERDGGASHPRLLLKRPGPGDWNYFELLLKGFALTLRSGRTAHRIFVLSPPRSDRGAWTRFDVEVDPHNTTEVEVFEGPVEVARVAVRGASVLVRTGYSTRVRQGRAPEPPVPTQKIRPGVEASDEQMGAEFAGESQMDVRRGQENEMAKCAIRGQRNWKKKPGRKRGSPGSDHDKPKPRQH